MTATLRKSLNGNWGLFQVRTYVVRGFYTYPKCACPDCTGRGHVKYEPMTDTTWVALYVHFSRDNVLAWAKETCIQVVDESGAVPV